MISPDVNAQKHLNNDRAKFNLQGDVALYEVRSFNADVWGTWDGAPKKSSTHSVEFYKNGKVKTDQFIAQTLGTIQRDYDETGKLMRITEIEPDGNLRSSINITYNNSDLPTKN